MNARRSCRTERRRSPDRVAAAGCTPSDTPDHTRRRRWWWRRRRRWGFLQVHVGLCHPHGHSRAVPEHVGDRSVLAEVDRQSPAPLDRHPVPNEATAGGTTRRQPFLRILVALAQVRARRHRPQRTAEHQVVREPVPGVVIPATSTRTPRFGQRHHMIDVHASCPKQRHSVVARKPLAPRDRAGHRPSDPALALLDQHLRPGVAPVMVPIKPAGELVPVVSARRPGMELRLIEAPHPGVGDRAAEPSTSQGG